MLKAYGQANVSGSLGLQFSFSIRGNIYISGLLLQEMYKYVKINSTLSLVSCQQSDNIQI